MNSRVRLIIPFSLLAFLLSACGGNNSSASSNLVCASVESYMSTKALALQESARGGSAVDSINAMVGGLLEVVDADAESKVVFESYFSAMKDWAVSADLYHLNQDRNFLANAAIELESQIDSLIPHCESKGWNFENGWRG